MGKTIEQQLTEEISVLRYRVDKLETALEKCQVVLAKNYLMTQTLNDEIIKKLDSLQEKLK